MSSSQPLVSIILPVYNGAQMVCAALESAFAQTFQDFEIIAIDDGSTDDSAQILGSFEPRIRVLNQKNGGASKARNLGIESARGEWVAFLDADDIWEPQKLEKQVELMRQNPKTGVSFSECLYFDENREWNADFGARVPAMSAIFEAMLSEHFIAMSSVMVRRECFQKVGVFDESLVGCEDYNLFLRLARQFQFRFLAEPLVKLRCHDGNLSNDLPQMCHDEIANLDKIAALFPDLAIPKRRLKSKILFRFGGYYFDAGDFKSARSCFARALACAPLQLKNYPFLCAALLPESVRENARNVVRVVRRSGKSEEKTNSEEVPNAPQKSTLGTSDSQLPTPNSTAPKTVVMVTWSLVAGGSETYALTLAKNLDPAQFKPVLCALDQGGALESEIARLEIPFHIMHRAPGLQFRLMARMFRLFRAHRAKIVHTHHFNQLFYSLLGAKLCGARVIHTEHSIEAYKSPRLRLALRILSLGCYRVLAIGDDGARVLRENVGISPRKLEIVRAGIDLDAFNEARDDARRELEIGANVPIAAIVARLSPEKNHRVLLEAWKKVVEKIPDAVLLLAGEGGEKAALCAQIETLNLENRVQLLGVRRDVARVLAACDCFVLSSDREGLPVSVLEAMAAARPVVATSVGDLPLVVRPNETGFLVPPCDADALSEALIAVLSDQARAQKMGEAGKRAVASFGLEPMIEAHQKLYGACKEDKS